MAKFLSYNQMAAYLIKDILIISALLGPLANWTMETLEEPSAHMLYCTFYPYIPRRMLVRMDLGEIPRLLLLC